MNEISFYENLDAVFTGTHDIAAKDDNKCYKGCIPSSTINQRNLRNILANIGTYGKFDLVFLTGNSYDWVRGRILENFALCDIPNVNIVVIPENGLIAQSMEDGIYWIERPSKDYENAIENIEKYAHDKFAGWFWLQGNMRRLTFKPVKGCEFFDEEFVPEIVKIAKKYDIVPFDIEKGFGDEVGVIYHYLGSSVNIDPRKVRIIKRKGSEESEEFDLDFRGKETAVKLISEIKNYGPVACIAGSSNDYPMVKAVCERDGMVYLPKNHGFSDNEIKKLRCEVESFGKRPDIQTVETESILSTVLGAYLNNQRKVVSR